MSGYVLEYAISPYEGVRNDLQKAWADPDYDTLDDREASKDYLIICFVAELPIEPPGFYTAFVTEKWVFVISVALVVTTLETRTVLSIKSEVTLVLGAEWLVCVASYEGAPPLPALQ